jgi:transcriptional regulator with XRE-family HTH domain
MINLPAFLKIKLREKKWTAYRLQKESGINRSTLSRILRGGIKKPAYETLKILANILDADIQELLIVSGQEKSSKSPNEQEIQHQIGKITFYASPIITPEKANGYDKKNHNFITSSAKECIPIAVEGDQKNLFSVRWQTRIFDFQVGDIFVVAPSQKVYDGAYVILKSKSGIPEIFKYHAQSDASALLISETNSVDFKKKEKNIIGVIIQSIRKL